MDINLSALQHSDSKISKILLKALQVAVHKFDATNSTWAKTNSEGSMFVCSRSEEPRYILIILNKLSRDNFIEPITIDMDVVQQNEQFLLYRKSNNYIRALGFSDNEDCSKMASIVTHIAERIRKNIKSSENDNAQQRSIVDLLDNAKIKHVHPEVHPTLVNNHQNNTMIAKPIPLQVSSLLQNRHSTPVGGDLLQRLLNDSSTKLAAVAQVTPNTRENPHLLVIERQTNSTMLSETPKKPSAINRDSFHARTPNNQSVPFASGHFDINGDILLTPADLSSGVDKLTVYDDPISSTVNGSQINNFPIDMNTARNTLIDLIQNDDELVTLIYEKLVWHHQKNNYAERRFR